jgi:galactonate dehydratase
MKITTIETFPFWIDWCNWLFVRVSTDEGVYGWGEGSLHGAIASVETAIHELGEILIGEDPAGVERHWQRMYHAWRWRGGAVQATALAALDIALWDIEGKRLGVPVYRLLGGAQRNRLRVYASHWLSGITTPEQAYAGARDAVARGYGAFKWTAFQRDALQRNERQAIHRVAELLGAAREAVGPDIEIFIECAERLTPGSAVAAARALEPYGPGWFEEPIPFENAKAMAQLQRDIEVPIATGERLLSRWEYRELLEEQGCRFIQPDLMHAHGISEVRRIAWMADTYGVRVAPHNPGGPICNLAAMHLAAAIPNFYILEQMETERALHDAVATSPVRFADGYVSLPDAPGLGTDLNLEVLAGRTVRPQPFNRTSEELPHEQ